jgi:lipooligosaccharide transport system permease protein
MLSGVFFPVEQLPAGVQSVARLLPLYHGVAIVRPLLLGQPSSGWIVHLAVIGAYAIVAFYVAVLLTRRRLLN